jgi:ClpP class serine protease
VKPLEALLRAPWLITPDGGDLVLAVYQRWLTTARDERVAAALDARGGAPFEGNEHDTELVGDVAIVSIDGPLIRKAELLDDLSSGATSYQWIESQCSQIAAAVETGTVRNAILRFNTPGGEAAGCGICGDAIRRLRAALEARAGELIGYCETQASSGGLWLISQCTRRVAHVASRTGSLGVRFMLTDTSKAEKKFGIVRHEIISKGSEGKRGTPVDAEVLDRVQVLANDIFATFVDAVADGCGVTPEYALAHFGGGDELIAAKALEAGIVDELGDLDSILASLQSGGARIPTSRPTFGARGTMNKDAAQRAAGAPPTVSDADNEWKCEGCGEMMGPSAKSYCAKCAAGSGDEDEPDGDEDEDTKALRGFGLLGKTRGETRARCTAFARSITAATGEKTAAGALGTIAAAVGDAATLKAEREEQRKTAEAARPKALREKLTAAVLTGRVKLGELAQTVPVLLGASMGAAEKALAAVEKQEIGPIAGALASVPVSPEALASVETWIDRHPGPAMPAAASQPGDKDPAAQAAIDAVTPATGSPLTFSFANAAKAATAPKGA